MKFAVLVSERAVDDVIRIRTGDRGHKALTYEGDIDTRQAVPQ